MHARHLPGDSPTATPDFSIVVGGPLYQLMRRARLADGAMGLVHRRILVAVAVMWAPIVALTAIQGGFVGPGPRTGLLFDIGFHLRFLVVVPVLILSELIVHRRMRPVIEEFQTRGLVPPSQRDRFERALDEAAVWRNAILGEVAMLAAVYAAGILITLRRYEALGGDGWYAASPQGSGLSLAGFWLVFVSLPLMQFLLLRWYYRLFIWARFLWRVSRLDLDLSVTHPDKVGGLGFLAESLVAFVPVAMAHGVLLTGEISDRILFAGARLTEFQMEVLAVALFLVLVFGGPLTVFAPQLARVKRRGLREYGALGQTYVRDFRRKWMSGPPPAGEALVGSGDIQSLADLGNSFATAEQMRLTPIRPVSLAYFVLAFLAPIAPLLLTVMPAKELLAHVAELLF